MWLGISTENQEWYNKRWPILSQIPAAIRFISAEPMLGKIDLDEVNFDPEEPSIAIGDYGLPDWIITGGESDMGKGVARPTHPDVFLDLATQAWANHIPLYFKLMGRVGTRVRTRPQPTGPGDGRDG